MVRLIHCITGVEIQVSEERLEEYLAQGHEPVKDTPKEKPKRKKRTKKGA